jgi:hypothetical protein
LRFFRVLFLALLLAACTEPPSIDELIDQAAEQIAAGDAQAAIVTFKQAVALSPDDPQVRLKMAGAYLAAERGDLAAVTLKQAAERGADPALVRLAQADALLMQNKFLEVLDLQMPPVATSAQAISLQWRQARARLGLYDRKQQDGGLVSRAYLELFQAIDDSPDAAALAPMVASLDASRQKAKPVDRAWQHFSCQRETLTTSNWQSESPTEASILRVGPTRQLKTPAEAARVAGNGAIIEIDAGNYPGGVARWEQDGLTVRGVGGRPVITADGKSVAKRDAWLFTGNDIRVENVEISGARSVYKNGAGIRHAGRNLVLQHVYLHDNENGLLTANNHPDSDIQIAYSEFARNGDGKGQAHNLYIGRAGRLEMRYSYSHEANIGHLLKSRARRNFIRYNRLSDNEEGRSSYLIDIPEGGEAEIVGNVLQQGYGTENHSMISFAAESAPHKENTLVVASNTLYNRDLGGIIVRNPRQLDVLVINNLIAGVPLVLVDGPGRETANLMAPDHGLADPRGFDFNLLSGSRAIDKGSAKGPVPTAEYVHPLGWRPRLSVWNLDIGAYERCGL